LVLLGLLLLAGTADAHPISITEAYVYVTRERVTVHLEVYLEDLFLFHDLQLNEQDFLEPDIIERGIGKHRDFLLERFLVRDAIGESLAGRCTEVKRFEMQSEGVPLAESMAHKLTFVFEYLTADPPEFLTFSQHLVDDKLLLPAEMQLWVRQENAEEPDQHLLYPDAPHSVRFDWQHPPLSPEASEQQRQQWHQQQKEATLGITSYSAVYSFLYIDDHEVRHEILIPLATLEDSVLIARAGDAFLEVAEQDAAREQIAAFFTAGNPLEIDGVTVAPVVERLDFYGLDFTDFASPAEPRRVSLANARVGIILSYSTKGTPNTVRVTWDRFNRYVWAVTMIVYAYDDTQTAALSRIGEQDTFQWQNPGRAPLPPLEQVDVLLPPRPMWSLPLVTLGCTLLVPALLLGLPRRRSLGRFRGPLALLLAGCAVTGWPLARWTLPSPLAAAPQLSDEQAGAILAALHKNAYRAFDYRDEQDVYDALAKSVDGPLLNELYLQIRRGLEMREQGGAVSRIREVKMVDSRRWNGPAFAELADERGFAYRCRWTVAGTVEHWGHVHARTNEYEALFTVEPRDNAWKITALDVRNERRVSFETSLRGL
jgi:hypothetical protein